jgi:hypothetical protein
MENLYTVDYFIKFFGEKPENRWLKFKQEDRNGNHCAIGFCNFETKNSLGGDKYRALRKIFSDVSVTIGNIPPKHIRENQYRKGHKVAGTNAVTAINNGVALEYQQSTPKLRVLAALQDIKAKLEPKIEEKPIIKREYKVVRITESILNTELILN